MSNLQQIGVNLSQGQKQKLARAYRNNEGVTIRLANHSLSGSDVLMVPANTARKLVKNRNGGKGMQITITKSNIRKQSGSGIFSAVLPALRAVAPTIGKTLGLSALAGAASEGESQIIKKITGGQLFQIPHKDLGALALAAHLLTGKQRRDLVNADKSKKDMLFRVTPKQVGNGIGSILVGIGIPLALDVIKGITDRGAPRMGNRGGGSPRIGAPPPFIGTWGRGKKKKTRGKGLLLGKNSPFRNIPLVGTFYKRRRLCWRSPEWFLF